MKINDRNYVAGVKTVLETILPVVPGWRIGFGTEIKVTVEVPREAARAAIADIKEQADELVESRGIKFGEDSFSYGPIEVIGVDAEPVPMHRGLAVWILHTEKENAVKAEFPHTKDGVILIPSMDLPKEAEERLDAINVDSESRMPDGIGGMESLALRMRALSFAQTQPEMWDDLVLEAKAVLSEEVA